MKYWLLSNQGKQTWAYATYRFKIPTFKLAPVRKFMIYLCADKNIKTYQKANSPRYAHEAAINFFREKGKLS